jgi:hypothetical protein
MKTGHTKLLIVAIAVLLDVPGEAGEAAQSREQAKAAVKAHLSGMKTAEYGELLDLEAEPLQTLFKDCRFFVLRFGVYPVAVEAEPPLKTNNLFVVCEGRITHVTDEQQLKQFFMRRLASSSQPISPSAATESWLYLVQELHKDGFFQFQPPSVSKSGEASEGSTEVVAQRGDKGKLSVKMEFKEGKLVAVTSEGSVSPGVRPRCQATRLLDEDPVVREIMWRDIVIMGRAGKPYLNEVRATAGPALQQAIDQVWQQILAEDR